MSAPSAIDRKIRVAHLVSHPIQYFAPLYRSLAQRDEIDLTVFFYSGQSLQEYFDGGFGRKLNWDVPLVGGYKYFLSPESRDRKVLESVDWRPSWPVLKQILTGKYDVIWLHGYAFINSWIVTVFARLTGTPVLLRDDQTLLTPRSRLSRLVKKIVLPIIYKNVKGLYVGKNNENYFREFGTKTLFNARYSVNNENLGARYRELRPARREIRRRFGIHTSDPIILFSGKLIDKKKPQLLLEAFQKVRQDLKCYLLFVGDGPLRASLEDCVKAQSIPDVHFAGFLNQTELPSAYTAADLLVLPSAYQETWGLVVNEAMNFELPIIVSDQVGCAPDLVEHGENGYVFHSGDAAGLITALQSIVESKEKRLAFGRRSAEIIAGYTSETCAEQIVRACVSVKNGSSSRDLILNQLGGCANLSE